MKRTCAGITRGGTQYPNVAIRGEYCFRHGPEVAASRQPGNREGGFGKRTERRIAKRMPKDLQDTLATLYRVMASVESGEMEPARASAIAAVPELSQGLRPGLKRKLESEARLEALKAATGVVVVAEPCELDLAVLSDRLNLPLQARLALYRSVYAAIGNLSDENRMRRLDSPAQMVIGDVQRLLNEVDGAGRPRRVGGSVPHRCMRGSRLHDAVDRCLILGRH